MTFYVAATLAVLAVGHGFLAAPRLDPDDAKRKKPSFSLRATPSVGFTPVRISFVAELRGGSNDYEDFYCATILWEWGDGTESEESTDCEPYVAGKSEIRRRFSKAHQYHTASEYRVQIRLKKAGKVVGSASTSIRLRPGVREWGSSPGALR